MLNESNHTLEDHISMLRELDSQRKESASLRDEGIIALLDKEDSLLSSSPLSFEIPLTLWALSVRNTHPLENKDDENSRLGLMKKLAEKLATITLNKIASHDMSILFAAETLRALTVVPGYGFSKTAILCYYWLVRELYTAERADWSTGGLRAGHKGQVTAFTTGKCIYALQSFANAQKKTGELIASIGEFHNTIDQFNKLQEKYPDLLVEWLAVERKRYSLSQFIKLSHIYNKIVFKIESPDDKLDQYINHMLDNTHCQTFDLQDIVNNKFKFAESEFKAAINGIKTYRKKECKEPENKNIERSEYGHSLALNAINDAKNRLREGQHWVTDKKWDEIKNGFDEAAREVEKVLRPTKVFLSSILDRELSTISLGVCRINNPNLEHIIALQIFKKLFFGFAVSAPCFLNMSAILSCITLLMHAFFSNSTQY